MNDDDPIGCARAIIWIVAGAVTGCALGLLLHLSGLMG